LRRLFAADEAANKENDNESDSSSSSSGSGSGRNFVHIVAKFCAATYYFSSSIYSCA